MRSSGLRGAGLVVVVVAALGVGAGPAGAVIAPGAAGASIGMSPTLGGPVPASSGSEVVGERTEFSRTLRESDGKMLTEIGTVPLHFKDPSGDWQPIDPSLSEGPSGELSNAAAGFDISLPASLDDAPAKVTASGRWVSFALNGAASSDADIAGATASYGDALDGTDVEYESLAQGLKETLVLGDASAASSYAFSIATSAGLSPLLLSDGTVEFRDGGGVVRFTLPAPTVQARDQDAPSTAHVAYQLSSDKKTLSIVVDPGWLADASFPVKVDPTVYPGAVTGCTLTSGAPTVSDCNTSLMGVGGGSSGRKRAILRFNDLAAIKTKAVIVNARLQLAWQTQDVTGTDTTVNVHSMGDTMGYGATWDTINGSAPWASPGGTISNTPIESVLLQSAYVGQRVSWDVSPEVDDWLHDPATLNNGLAVVAANEATASNYLSFYGPGYSSTGPNDGPPRLMVEWVNHAGSERDATIESTGLDDRSGVAVNASAGNALIDSTDLSLPGIAGTGLTIGRTYNSQDAGDVREFGTAWSMSINGAGTDMRRYAPGNVQVLRANGGASYRFDRDIPNDVPGVSYAFTTPPGIDADMSVSAVDDTTTVTFRKTGMTWIYSSPVAYGGPDKSGRLVRITDRNANNIQMTYDASGNLSSILDTYLHNVVVSKNAQGFITKLAYGGREWTYGYTANNDAGGTPHQVLSSFKNPDLKETVYSYLAAGSAGGDYDRVSNARDARSHSIGLTYDADGAVATVRRYIDGTSNDVITTWAFTPAAGFGAYCTSTGLSSGTLTPGVLGRSVQTDPRGNKTTYCYNARGQVIQTFDAQTRQQATKYTGAANVLEFTGLAGTANAGLSTFTFDSGAGGTGNLMGGSGPMGETFSIAYCTGGGCSSTDKLDKYRPRSFTDEQSTQTLYGYDSVGNLTDVKDAQSPVRNQQTLTYWGDGTIKTATDANGRVTNFASSYGQITTITPPTITGGTLLGATTLTYDSSARIKTIKDGRGTTSTITYDGEDRITRVDYSSGSWMTFTFDENGNLTQRVDSDGNTTSYTYDRLNRRLTEAFPGSRSNTYTYDKASNLQTLLDGGGTTTYSYDTINRLASIISPKPGSGTDTISYAYADTPGITQTATFPGGLQQITTADKSGKTTSTVVKSSGGSTLKSLAYAYLPAGASADAGLLQKLTDNAGNVTSYTYKDSAAKEDVGRLVDATTVNGATPVDNYHYTYDPAGNRLSKSVKIGAGTPTVTSYAYNEANEMCWFYTGTSAAACGSPPAGAVSYTHDAQGNRTSGNSTSYTYDARNRLTSKTGSTFTYLSPGNGELASQTSGGVTTSYQNNVLGLGREIVTGGNIDYTRQPNGAPIAERTSSAKRFFLTDRLGTVRWLADSNGGTSAITRTLTYDPTGETTSNTTSGAGGPDTNLRFAGGHVVNGHVHFGARYYDAKHAQWTQQDPLNQISSLTEANRYTYAAANPVNYADPSGEIVPALIVGARAAAPIVIRSGLLRNATGEVIGTVRGTEVVAQASGRIGRAGELVSDAVNVANKAAHLIPNPFG